MSRQNIPLLTTTQTATEAITADRFAAYTGAPPAAAGNTAGVARSSAAIGEKYPVDVVGTAIVEASAAIALGAAIETLADGRAVTKSTGITVARALQAATAAGQFIEVLLIVN